MINAFIVVGSMLLYLLALFGIAHYADKKRDEGHSIVSNPYVYAISLGVYCTAWTFYGSIGRAAQTGLGFVPIYIGPSLAMLFGWLMIRKMVRISKEYRLTSISDFVSFRYGRSYSLGLLVTLVSLIVITPYVALQLIAISSSIQILTAGTDLLIETKFLAAALLAAFAVMFGARHLDPMERHEGLIAAVAFESVVKLIAFIIAGIYITWGCFGGYSEIIQGILSKPDLSHLIDIDYVSWFSITLISFFAVFLLPRQFHLMVVENSNEDHIKKAMWIFPLYLLLINIFVPAVAGAGLLMNIQGVQDMFIINIPEIYGAELIALLVFLGGASAATAMVLVDSVAVGTMLLNELEMPHLMRYLGKGRDLPSLLLKMKRINILIVMALGYIYSLAVGYSSLADIGLLSFLAVSQIAPAALGGLYWKKGSREGAIAGMVAGFILWIYTALLPSAAKFGWLATDLVSNGPFGLSFLRPTSLFGIELDVWSHSVFWTLLVNVSLYVIVSLASRPTESEAELADGFVNVYETRESPLAERRSIRIGTVDELEATLARYVGDDRAKNVVDANLVQLRTNRRDIDARQLLELWDLSESILTGSLGPSATRIIVEDVVRITPVLERPKTTTPTTPSYQLAAGKVYGVEKVAYEVFTDSVTHGLEGLCITTHDIDDVRRVWGLAETPIVRLSHLKGGNERYIAPTNLPLLFLTIKAFVESSKNSVVLIDSLQYLVDENKGLVPDSDVLDFVNEIERISHSANTRFILVASPDFLNVPLTKDVQEISELLFSLKPLPSYLLKYFVQEILKSSEAPHEAVLEINSLLASGDLFSKSGDAVSDEDSSCDPDMKGEASYGFELVVDPSLKMTRREFFSALRRIGRLVSRYVPRFDLKRSLKDTMDKFRFSIYELILTPGTTYVVEEDKPLRSMEIFSELVHLGMSGLCISRYNPDILKERYDIEPEMVIWLTQKGSAGGFKSVDPTNFPRLSSMISDFLRQFKEPVILMEGLGYLITQSNYETVLRFIQSQRDDIALREALLLVHIDPLSLDTKELHRLEGEMEPLEPIGSNNKHENPVTGGE